jgi:hypothetical protein
MRVRYRIDMEKELRSACGNSVAVHGELPKSARLQWLFEVLIPWPRCAISLSYSFI